MKKGVVLSLIILPLALSCNNNSNGFVNPFPDDDYNNNHKIGFRFSDDEKIVRSLTENEKKNVNATLSDVGFSEHITKRTGEKHIRDYTRAFAGEFKQGYNTSNLMEDINEVVTFQLEDTTANHFTRRITKNESTKTVSYTYGNIEERLKTEEYRYLCNYEKDYLITEDNPLKEVKSTATTPDNPKSINDRIVKTENFEKKTNEEFKKIYDRLITDIDDQHTTDYYLDKYFYISQNDYIFAPDSNCGADINDNVILVQSKQEQYSKGTTPGVYEIQDGRKYKAMTNSITVTILSKVDETSTKIKDRYIVSKVRKYTEDVITSDVIQPNVPITKLDTPFPLHYEEDYYRFSIDKIDFDVTDLSTLKEESREKAI